MQALAVLVRSISAVNWLVGQILSWLALACVLVCFTVVVQRYVFNTSTLWMQDLFVYVVWTYGYPAVARSWGYFEGSANIGGMPGLFILKSFILLFAALVGLQGLAMAARSVRVLAGRDELLPPHLRYEQPDENDHPAGEIA